MRLVCPNCDAQYEVDDSVIPEPGRDVQCSNCGLMWFQPGKSAMAEAEQVEIDEDDEALDDDWDPPVTRRPVPVSGTPPEPPAPATEPASEPKPEARTIDPFEKAAAAKSAKRAPEPQPEPAPVAAPDEPEEATAPASEPAPEGTAASSVSAMMAAFDADTEDDEELPPPPAKDAALESAPQPGAQPRRTLDDSLLSILREEAERESRARRAEGSSLETQEELNLASAPAPAPVLPPKPKSVPDFDGVFAADMMPPDEPDEALAEERVADLGAHEEAAHPPHSGRERLPDIEEINSTLRAASERTLGRGTIVRSDAAEARSGFRLGFTSVMAFALVATLVYVFAPQISERIPAAGPTLTQYVTLVDAGRLWLDGQLQHAIDVMQSAQAN